MKFITQQSTLNKALSIAGKVSAENKIIPILECFKFSVKPGRLDLSASDLQISIKTHIAIEANETFAFCVIASDISNLIKSLPDQPLVFEYIKTIRTNKNETDPVVTFSLSITSSSGMYNLPVENADDFPKIPKKTGETITLNSEDFLEGIYKTVFAVSKDEFRPAFTGVLLTVKDKFICYSATDAHSLSTYKYPTDSHQEFEIIIPAKTLATIQNLQPTGEIELAISKDQLSISFGDVYSTHRLIDEIFPDFRSVIPVDNPIIMQIDRLRLIGVVKRVISFGRESAVKLSVSESELLISGENIDYAKEAKETVDCTCNGNIIIGANGAFLVNILQHLSTDVIEMSFSIPSRAIIFKEEGFDGLMLLMPVYFN